MTIYDQRLSPTPVSSPSPPVRDVSHTVDKDYRLSTDWCLSRSYHSLDVWCVILSFIPLQTSLRRHSFLFLFFLVFHLSLNRIPKRTSRGLRIFFTNVMSEWLGDIIHMYTYVYKRIILYFVLSLISVL